MGAFDAAGPLLRVQGWIGVDRERSPLEVGSVLDGRRADQVVEAGGKVPLDNAALTSQKVQFARRQLASHRGSFHSLSLKAGLVAQLRRVGAVPTCRGPRLKRDRSPESPGRRVAAWSVRRGCNSFG